MGMDIPGDALQSFRTVVHGVHAGHHGEQCLGRADVAGGFVAADVLFPRLQRHAQTLFAATVLAHTDDAARQQTLVFLRGAEERGVRPTVAQGYSESLTVAHHHIGTPFTRRGQQHQGQEVCTDSCADTSRFRFASDAAIVVHAAIDGRVLQRKTEVTVRRIEVVHIAHHQLHTDGCATRAQDVDVLRIEALVGEELVGFAEFLGPCRVQHVHGFGDGGGLVEQAGVRDRQTGEVAAHRLEVQQSFQSPLGDLSLVRRVGRVPSRILEYVALDGRRKDGAAEAKTDVAAEHLVLRTEGAHVVQVFAFGHRRAHVQFPAADAFRHGSIDQFIEAAYADGLEHGGGLVVVGTDVALLVGDG